MNNAVWWINELAHKLNCKIISTLLMPPSFQFENYLPQFKFYFFYNSWMIPISSSPKLWYTCHIFCGFHKLPHILIISLRFISLNVNRDKIIFIRYLERPLRQRILLLLKSPISIFIPITSLSVVHDNSKFCYFILLIFFMILSCMLVSLNNYSILPALELNKYRIIICILLYSSVTCFVMFLW